MYHLRKVGFQMCHSHLRPTVLYYGYAVIKRLHTGPSCQVMKHGGRFPSCSIYVLHQTEQPSVRSNYFKTGPFLFAFHLHTGLNWRTSARNGKATNKEERKQKQ